MTCRFIGDLLMLVLISARSSAKLDDRGVVLLDDGSVTNVSLRNIRDNEAFAQRISIESSSDVTFNITDININVNFIIFQIHTYQFNVTLSYDKESLRKVTNRSIFGSNIGLYVKPSFNRMAQMYLRNDNVRVVEAMIAAVVYDDRAPTPGGCNMEFNTEIAPYQKLLARDAVIIVDAQPASEPVPGLNLNSDCQRSRVKNKMYRLYLPGQDFSHETYFSLISTMLTVDKIILNGNKVPRSTTSSQLRRVFSAYTGVGSVYATVATYEDYSAAYVPSFSYACNPVLYPETCEVLNDSMSKVFCAAVFFLGCFCIYTCKSIEHEMILSVLFTGTVMFYAISVGSGDYSDGTNISLGFLGGVFVAGLWQATRLFFPLLSSFLCGLTSGWFLASILYFHAPDTFVISNNAWIFWTLYVTVVLTLSVFTLLLQNIFITVTFAIFTSYMIVLPIDYYLGSSMKYIIISFVRRTTEADFGDAIIQPPFQVSDFCLTILWIALAVYSVFRQFYRRHSSNQLVNTERRPLILPNNYDYNSVTL